MDISKENYDIEKLKKHAPEVNAKGRVRLAKADSYMDASYELYTEEVTQNRGIFYRVKKFFKRIFHR